MDFKQEINENGGTIYGFKNGEKRAHINLHFDKPGSMVISFVYVNPALRGGGAGAQMVHEAIELARKEKRQVRATCSYAASVLQLRREKYADVLA